MSCSLRRAKWSEESMSRICAVMSVKWRPRCDDTRCDGDVRIILRTEGLFIIKTRRLCVVHDTVYNHKTSGVDGKHRNLQRLT
jgi:hypothetical protein